jgi:tight adherence protein B
MKVQKLLIDTLSAEDNEILDKKEQRQLKIEKSWLLQQLYYAGYTNASAEYTFIAIAFTFGFVGSFFLFTTINSIPVFIITFFILAAIPLLILKKIVKLREEEFNLSLKEIIDKVTNMMRSGVGFEQALQKSILTTKSEYAQKLFSIYLNEKNVIGEEMAFLKMFDLVESKELRIFYLVVSIGKQSGGKFSNTLETLRKTLHSQGEIKQQITSSTREIRVGSYMIIGIIVFIYILMNNSMNNVLNEYFFYDDKGKVQMFFIALWVALGLFVNNLLTKIK